MMINALKKMHTKLSDVVEYTLDIHGVSHKMNDYIGQNIFCHTWSMWFFYMFFFEGITMAQIDELAGTGRIKNKNNLLLIKKFTTP